MMSRENVKVTVRIDVGKMCERVVAQIMRRSKCTRAICVLVSGRSSNVTGENTKNILDSISIDVCLARVGNRGTVVAEVSDVVQITVFLVRVSRADAVVARIADAIRVNVRLIRIHDQHAVVFIVRDSVAVVVPWIGHVEENVERI